jgi:hypothetical protein
LMSNHFQLLLRNGFVPISYVKRPGGIYGKKCQSYSIPHLN